MKPWDEISTQALIGTDRQSFTVPQLPAALHAAIARITDDTPEAKLLTSAVLIQTYTQAGQILPQRKQNPIPIAPDEERPPCSPEAGQLMLRLFSDEEGMLKKFSSRLAIEWMDLAEKAGCLAPPACLAALLRRAEHDRDLREKVILQRGCVLGRRAAWLAQLNKDWAYAANSTLTDNASIWEEGLPEERKDYLARLRASDPAGARDLLAATWGKENARDRKDFLEAFHIGLGLEDEAFLEGVLEDRSKDVRHTAARLLSCLELSQFSQRMMKRLRQYVPYFGKDKILMEIPDKVDAELEHDQINKGKTWYEAGVSRERVEIPHGQEREILRQTVALTPLKCWESIRALSPDDLIAVAKQTDWGADFLLGWTDAAQTQRNCAWLRALSWSDDGHHNILLVRQLPGQILQDFLKELLETRHDSVNLSLLSESLKHEELAIDGSLASLFFRQVSERYNDFAKFSSEWKPFFISLSLKADPTCLSEAKGFAQQIEIHLPALKGELENLISMLEIRHAMHKELRQ